MMAFLAGLIIGTNLGIGILAVLKAGSSHDE